MLDELSRREYLRAIGIDVWVPRDVADVELPESSQQAAPVRLDSAAAGEEWQSLRSAVAQCTACELHQGRQQTVFGVGNPEADWMVIGEAPGAEEDREGEPFVGRAGKLLDEILASVGLDRDTVFIANILKCRPPGNRDPHADEAAACRGFLERQIALVRPKLILAVGRIAAQQLLQCETPVGRLRGQVHTLGATEIPVIVTYHPAYLLRSPGQKRKVWEDLCLARQCLAGGLT
jgi:DNA polymerase